MKTLSESEKPGASGLLSRIFAVRHAWAAPLILTLALVPVSYFNFLLFHTLAEFFAIVVAIILSVVAWYTYRFTRNDYLMYLGTGYFWIGFLDLLHVLTFKGINILPHADANTSIQFWVVTRALEAALLLTAPYFLLHRLKRELSLALFGVGAAATIYSINQGWLPDTYIDGMGLTSFKINAEYTIIAILIAAIAVTYKFRALLDHRIFVLIVFSAAATIAAELCFTLYVSVYGTFIFIGHIFKLLSYWLIFYAVVRTTLTDPYEFMSKTSGTYDAIPMPTIVIDHNGIIQQANNAAGTSANMAPLSLIGSHCHGYFHAAETKVADCPICNMISGGKSDLPHELCIGDGKWSEITLSPFDKDEHDDLMVHVATDISDRKKIERELVQQANYDQLTRLPNRNLVIDRLEQTMLRANRNNDHTALMFIDIDNFKTINDTLGHSIGDRLLVELSQLLAGSVRESDVVGRWGGDEFLVMLGCINKLEDAEPIATKILSALSSPVMIDDREFNVSASIGISGYPDDSCNINELLSHADAAMYLAKESGKNAYRFFSSEINKKAQMDMEMGNDLRHSVERNELSIVYQPQINLHTGEIVGAEALLRWNHPLYGMVPPSEFIPIAEKANLFEHIGGWIISRACQDAALWNKDRNHPISLSINVSSRQIRLSNFIELMATTISSSGIDPGLVNIEITEHMLLNDTEENIDILEQIKALGMMISLDDFGTGYSSLSYLQKFPFDEIKIDKRFVRDIHHDPNDAALCRAIIAMAKSLELSIVGEGVELKEQLDFLKSYDVDTAQGFYFSKALSCEQFMDHLNNPAVTL
ncbi:MAG: EAL domain-containing protein [Proteobacteria bacterium]|nr:EAL domain-containing protein [Pseudomonadota bacterium]